MIISQIKYWPFPLGTHTLAGDANIYVRNNHPRQKAESEQVLLEQRKGKIIFSLELGVESKHVMWFHIFLLSPDSVRQGFGSKIERGAQSLLPVELKGYQKLSVNEFIYIHL